MNALLLTLLSSMSLCFAANQPGAIKSENMPNLVHLGLVDGKNYYADGFAGYTWFEASSFCQENGMQLATIETMNQAVLLNASYNSNTFSGNFWTDGRDARLPRQFSWNATDSEIPEVVDWLMRDGFSYQTCVYYHSSSGQSNLQPWICDGTMGTGGTLCQQYTTDF